MFGLLLDVCATACHRHCVARSMEAATIDTMDAAYANAGPAESASIPSGNDGRAADQIGYYETRPYTKGQWSHRLKRY